MVMCFVPDCKHYSEQKTCKFFSFPRNLRERASWIALIRRKDREPSHHSLVCSCHFVDHDRKNKPTIFEFSKKKKFKFESPEKRKRKATQASSSTAGPSKVSSLGATFAEEANIPSTSRRSSSSTATDEDMPSRSSSRATNVSFEATLEAENYFLKQELEEVTQKLKNLTTRFGFDHVKNNDSLVLMYTGIPTSALFCILVETMDKINVQYYAGWNVKLMSKADQIFLTLMKLKLNLPHEDLALRFSCSTASVTNIVMTWLYALHEVFFNQLMNTIPSRQKNQACLPGAFSKFKNCRIILDCTEIYSAVPTSMEHQRLTFSSYKHRNTWKILVGVAPNGVITFVSKAYPGSTSDKRVVEHCDVLKQMVSGDLILADKGFLIRDLLPEGVSLNVPPFLSTPQFTEAQVYETETIAKARIHVERAIRRIKCYQILQQIPQYYISHISIIFQLCAALTNFQYPLIKEVEEYYC